MCICWHRHMFSTSLPSNGHVLSAIMSQYVMGQGIRYFTALLDSFGHSERLCSQRSARCFWVKISFTELSCENSVRLSSSFDVRWHMTLWTSNKGFLNWSNFIQKQESIHEAVLGGLAGIHICNILFCPKAELLMQRKKKSGGHENDL